MVPREFLHLHLTSVHNFTSWDKPTRRKPESRELQWLVQDHRACWELKWDPNPGLWILSTVLFPLHQGAEVWGAKYKVASYIKSGVNTRCLEMGARLSVHGWPSHSILGPQISSRQYRCPAAFTGCQGPLAPKGKEEGAGRPCQGGLSDSCKCSNLQLQPSRELVRSAERWW